MNLFAVEPKFGRQPNGPTAAGHEHDINSYINRRALNRS
jgi:hypothetical protein